MTTTTSATSPRVNVPLLDLKLQYRSIRTDIDAAIARVVESQHFILGPEVAALEQEIAAYSDVAHAVGMSSGTDALLAALMAIDVGPGDEVITTPYSFFATAGVVARLGARSVFVDIDPVTYNIRSERVAEAITPRTRAVIPVHLYGCMADLTPIMDACRPHDIAVIEDAAQAIGAFDGQGRKAGSVGAMGCFSFFPSKNLGGFGDGGMTVTPDGPLAQRLRMMRMHGMEPKYYHSFVGGNFRLDALQAAVLRVKLRYLPQWSDARRRNAERYRALFAEAGIAVPVDVTDDAAPIILPHDEPGHIYNQFVIRARRRDELHEHLRASGIGTEIYYPVPLHLQQCFTGLGYHVGDFPVSELAARQTLALPIYPELTEEQLTATVHAIAAFYAAP